MNILSFISRNWLSALGLVALVELLNQCYFGSDKLIVVAVALTLLGIISSFAVPKSG